jgi:hypothetical protein
MSQLQSRFAGARGTGIGRGTRKDSGRCAFSTRAISSRISAAECGCFIRWSLTTGAGVACIGPSASRILSVIGVGSRWSPKARSTPDLPRTGRVAFTEGGGSPPRPIAEPYAKRVRATGHDVRPPACRQRHRRHVRSPNPAPRPDKDNPVSRPSRARQRTKGSAARAHRFWRTRRKRQRIPSRTPPRRIRAMGLARTHYRCRCRRRQLKAAHAPASCQPAIPIPAHPYKSDARRPSAPELSCTPPAP